MSASEVSRGCQGRPPEANSRGRRSTIHHSLAEFESASGIIGEATPIRDMIQIHTATGDITRFDVDAIVNAANPTLVGGGGVDGAIHAAGGPAILEECQDWVARNGPLPTGQAMITSAGDLPARHVIHTVGPVYSEHSPDDAARLLADCYRNSLDLAAQHSLGSVAFPNISTGVYGYPKEGAAEVAVFAVREWSDSRDGPNEVIFVCFDETNHRLYRELLES